MNTPMKKWYHGTGELGQQCYSMFQNRQELCEVCLILEYVQNISFQKQMLHSYDDIRDKAAVLEAQNKLLLNSLALRERQIQEIENTMQENMNLHIRPALDYLKKRVNEQDYQMLSSVFELSFSSLLTKKETKTIDLSNLTSREMPLGSPASSLMQVRTSDQKSFMVLRNCSSDTGRNPTRTGIPLKCQVSRFPLL